MSAHTSEDEIEEIFQLYKDLARELDPETGLGGKLLFAGELNIAGQRLIRAANVAGAASLGIAPDAADGRQAMREGVVDFLVNSLDEALRILKNEIRKRQAVAVGVTGALAAIVGEMLERGVRPDLLPARRSPESPEMEAFVAQGARRIESVKAPTGKTLLTLDVSQWANRMAAFDSMLRESLGPEDHASQRWLRLSSRYLPRGLRNWRSLECDPGTAARIRAVVASGKLDSAKR